MSSILRLFIATAILVGPEPPTIDVSEVTAAPIEDNLSTKFTVSGIRVQPSEVSGGGYAEIDTVQIEVVESRISDPEKCPEYKAWVVSTRYDSLDQYSATCQLSGRVPLRRGRVSGTVTFRVGARSAVPGDTSEMVYQECTVNVRN